MSFLYLPEFDASVRWYDSGQGAPIVFLPGLSMPVGQGFLAVAADPALAHRRCILIDYLGSGLSDHPTGFDYAMSSHAAVILRVLDHLDIQSVDIVGHSMGGTVGIQLALDHPSRVTSLVVGEGNVEPGGGMMSLRVSQDGEAAFLDGGYAALMSDLRAEARAGGGGPDRLVAGWQHADPKGLYANARALVDLPQDYFVQFAALPVPKTFVFGANNLGTPTPDTPDPDRLKQHGITPAVVENAGHAMMLDNHAGFIDVLTSALNR